MRLIVVFICIILISTALPAVGIVNIKENIANSPTGVGDIFKQLPKDPNDPLKNSYTSDSGTYNMRVYEDFWNITESICDIHWWSFSMKWVVFGWESCNPDGLKIDITFYDDNNSKPGSEVYSYSDIEYSFKGTGIMYEWFGGKFHEMLYFEAQLDPCVELTTGWVSIQSTYSPNGCSFLWMNSDDGNIHAYQYQPPLTKINDDLAFLLMDSKSDRPDLECYGSLSWSNVKPGSSVKGNFTVENIGGAGTLLDWEIVDEPSWGKWTFNPNGGEDLDPGNPITVQVTLIAPIEENLEFIGEINIINKENQSDNCSIPVYLKTPKKKSSIISSNIKFQEKNYIFLLIRY